MLPAIRIENIGKRYRVNHAVERAPYRTLRESLSSAFAAPLRRLRQGGATTQVEDFWALKNVSFDVQPGEVVGIIGRNGAGKSTLLKILTRITEPTTGRVTLRGRVASLLEVGTGFHPELTGRENVYMSGAILGMSRQEIRRNFDAIVEFAEVEKFLDTPVKRFSSGMYVRLAFAVAAHLEPEILIVDEVLAVGDAVFQHRCIEKMSSLANSGKSLVFVSHNLDLIPKLCDTAVLLDNGSVVEISDVECVLDRYRQALPSASATVALTHRKRHGSGAARFTSLRFFNDAGNPVDQIVCGRSLRCVLDVESAIDLRNVSLAIVIKTLQGTRLITGWTDEVGFVANLAADGQSFECCFHDVRIRPGRQVSIEIWMYNGDTLDHFEEVCKLPVVEEEPTGFSDRLDQGNVLCDYAWQCLVRDQ